MGAIDPASRALRFQGFGGGDIGEDHIFLDQLVRIEARGGIITRSMRPSGFSSSLRSGRLRSSGLRCSRAMFSACQAFP